MTRAAEQLNIVQPALGQQIRLLEESLGTPLLLRHSRGVTPTEAGGILYDKAIEILAAVEETRQIIAGLQPTKTAVRLGLTPSLVSLIGADMLYGAATDLPKISLVIIEELSFALLDALDRGDLDIALCFDGADRPGLHSRLIFSEELLFVSAPTQNRNETIAFTEVLQSDLVLAGDRDMVRRILTTAAEEAGLTPTITYEAQSVSAMREMVRKNLASSVMPYGTAVRELRDGFIIARRIVAPSLTRNLYVVEPNRGGIERVRTDFEPFLAIIIEKLFAELGSLASRPDSAPISAE